MIDIDIGFLLLLKSLYVLLWKDDGKVFVYLGNIFIRLKFFDGYILKYSIRFINFVNSYKVKDFVYEIS